MLTTTTSSGRRVEQPGSLVDLLRALAIRGLSRMFRPERQLFVHHVRRSPSGIALHGESVRYTAIVLIGLANESEAVVGDVLHGQRPADVCDRLLRLNDHGRLANLGDVALVYWAARALHCRGAQTTLARLGERLAAADRHKTVELAWTLSALCETTESDGPVALRDEVAQRLLRAHDARSDLFAHEAGADRAGLRDHIACFADLVYPIQALSRYHAVTSSPEALELADRCAARMCSLLGANGQWWWHYDARTARVIERYPVYTVHQDAMAPMALRALVDAGGHDHSHAMAKGLAWLVAAPELNGASLIDESRDVIWRKVARREPRKFVRRAQAVAVRIHPALRWPGVDRLFPAGVIDDECRPYHLGWLLYAWPARRPELAMTLR